MKLSKFVLKNGNIWVIFNEKLVKAKSLATKQIRINERKVEKKQTIDKIKKTVTR